MSRTYLDAASGQPMSPAASDMAERVRDIGWADPNGLHHEGKAAAALLQAARETVALVTDCDARWVTFLPAASAAESLVDAVRVSRGDSGVRWGVGAIETEALRSACNKQSRSGDTHLDLPVNSTGHLDDAALADFLRSANSDWDGAASILVAQAANAEIGTTQDLARIADVVSGSTASWICDATGLIGYRDVWAPGRTLLASAHGFAGPASTSLVITSPDTPLALAAEVSPSDAASTAAALFDLHHAKASDVARLAALTDTLRTRIPATIADVDVLGDPADTSPHTLTVSFLYADGERLANELDRRGIAVGSGSACASRAGLPSHVLVAIGALTHGNVRISLPRSATSDDVDALLAALPEAVAAVRTEAGAP